MWLGPLGIGSSSTNSDTAPVSRPVKYNKIQGGGSEGLMGQDHMVPLSKILERQHEFDMLADPSGWENEKIRKGYMVLTPRWSNPFILDFSYRPRGADMPEITEKEKWYPFPATYIMTACDNVEYVVGYHVFNDRETAEKWRGKDVIIPVVTAGWCADGLIGGQLEVFICRAFRWV